MIFEFDSYDRLLTCLPHPQSILQTAARGLPKCKSDRFTCFLKILSTSFPARWNSEASVFTTGSLSTISSLTTCPQHTLCWVEAAFLCYACLWLTQLFCGWMVSPYFLPIPYLTFSRQIYAFQGLVQMSSLCENFLDFPLIVFCDLIAYQTVLDWVFMCS